MVTFEDILKEVRTDWLGTSEDNEDCDLYEGGGYSFVNKDQIMTYANRALRHLEKSILGTRMDGEIFQANVEKILRTDQEYIELPEDILSAKVIHIHVSDPITHLGKISINESKDIILANIYAKIFETVQYSFVYKIKIVEGVPRLYVYPTAGRQHDICIEMWYVRKIKKFDENNDILELPVSLDYITAFINREIYRHDIHQFGINAQTSTYDEIVNDEYNKMMNVLQPLTGEEGVVKSKIDMDLYAGMT